jgi:hypothetical protein
MVVEIRNHHISQRPEAFKQAPEIRDGAQEHPLPARAADVWINVLQSHKRNAAFTRNFSVGQFWMPPK